MNVVHLIRIEAGEYRDQYGVRHECWNIVERATVVRTEENVAYEYYNETIRDPIYREVDGERRWRCCVPTDFGCPASWHRREDDERVKDEIWLKNREGGIYEYGRKPVIELKEEE